MTILNLVLFWFFIEICNVNYLISNIVSYCIAVILSYFLNSFITFHQINIETKKQLFNLIKFFGMKMILLCMDSICLFIMVHFFKINKYFSKIILTFVFLFISFSMTKLIIEGGKKVEKIFRTN